MGQNAKSDRRGVTWLRRKGEVLLEAIADLQTDCDKEVDKILLLTLAKREGISEGPGVRLTGGEGE